MALQAMLVSELRMKSIPVYYTKLAAVQHFPTHELDMQVYLGMADTHGNVLNLGRSNPTR